MVSKRYEMIYEVVKRIPKGRVATYGQVAELAGYAGEARQVGYALSALGEESGVPWQRVINAKGEISARWDPSCESEQVQLLRAEGVVVEEGKISLEKYRWRARG